MPKTAKSPANGKADPPARIVHALNHPLRIRILERLTREDTSASRLAASFDEPVTSLSYHLCRVLYKECGLVTVVERHQRRGAEERVFTLKRDAYFEVIRFSTTAIVALEAANGTARDRGLFAWHSVAVDERGQREISAAMQKLAETVRAAEDRCAGASASELHQLTVGTAAFEVAPPTGA